MGDSDATRGARQVGATPPMLKAVHTQKERGAAEAKAAQVVEKPEGMRLGKAVAIVREGMAETLAYMAFPRGHWRSVQTNNPLERLNMDQDSGGQVNTAADPIRADGSRVRSRTEFSTGARRSIMMDDILERAITRLRVPGMPRCTKPAIG